MGNNSFWLLILNDFVLSISLVQFENNAHYVSAVGPQVSYVPDRESIFKAVDTSLTDAATKIKLPEDQDPKTIALIIPPFWIGSDGKIISEKRKLIEYLCHDMKLKPMGFISNDDAIVEDANYTEGFPASFVLVNISATNMTVSLAYLGKIIERLSKPISYPFDPAILENCLVEFKSESTLPPQIILFGTFDDILVESVNNYPWIGKKNIETFLHLPEIKTYSPAEISSIYTRAIALQFNPQAQITPPNTILPDSDEVVESQNSFVDDQVEEIVEVSPSDLGFSDLTQSSPTVESSISVSEPDTIIEEKYVEPVTIPDTNINIKPKIIFPKLKLPKLKIPGLKLLLLPIVLSPLLILIPFFFSTAKITLYLTPYSFNKVFQVTLDPKASKINLTQNIIPINTKDFVINSSASVPTTGKKTIGEKAGGEIVVYNKQDKVQDLPKGTILLDSTGKKYELTVAAQIASSSSNLDAGVINLGQTKVMITATDIGPEYNLNKDTRLNFKDFPETFLVAKVKEQIAGGTKRQIQAVSAEDKANVDQKIKEIITKQIDDQSNKDIGQITGIIKDITQIKKGRIEYSRELGEETDELTANSVNTITVYYLDSSQKRSLIESYLSKESNYSDSIIDPEKFNITINSGKINGNTLSGLMTIEGKPTPKVDIASLTKKLSGQRQKKVQSILQKNIPKMYRYQLDRNFNLINDLNPLPYHLQNIIIEVK